MKKIVIFTLIIISFISVSCIDTQEPEMKYVVAAWLRKTETSSLFVTDEGFKLIPTVSVGATDNMYDKRYMLYYTVDNHVDSVYNINVKFFVDMDTTSVVTTSTAKPLDTYANNPVSPQIVWLSGCYINTYLKLRGIETKKHELFIVDDGQSSTDTIALYLRYDNKSDQAMSWYESVKAFNISPYLQHSTADSVVFKLNVNVESIGQTTAVLKAATKYKDVTK